MIHIAKVIALSFLAGFFIILIQLFTREVTLDGVRGVDFDLVYNFVNKKDNFNTPYLKKALHSLTKEDEVLFPMAILNKKGCVDNSLENSTKQICKLLENIDSFEKFIKTQKVLSINDKKYVNHTSHFFIYKQFTHMDGYLIGHAGKYVLSNDLEITKFFYFLENEFFNLFTTQDGRSKLWQKSKDMFFTIIFLSAFLGFLYLRRIKRNLLRYKLLLREKQLQKKEWDKALSEQKSIKKALDAKEEEIAIKESELAELLHSSTDDAKLKKEISQLKDSKDVMLSKLQDASQTITTLEVKEESLIKTILTQSKRLAKKDNASVNEQNFHELSEIKKLWRVEPKWQERSKIEINVATTDGHTPFTITQAFITFDAYILARATRKGYKANEKDDLYNAINFLQDNQLLRAGEKGLFHKIRKSRNEWFHHAKYPNDTIIKKLLDVLEFHNQKPLL